MGKKRKESKKKGKRKPGKRPTSKKHELYTQKEGGLKKRRMCPKCGPGVFLAKHENRYSCGKCGYTEFNR